MILQQFKRGIFLPVYDGQEASDVYPCPLETQQFSLYNRFWKAATLNTLTSFQFQRHTTKKNLVENEELNVYNFQDAYYILDRIPGSLAGTEDMDRCYLVSNEVAEYIMGMASDRKQG